MKKLKKLLLVLLIVTFAFMGLSRTNIVKAESAGPIYLGIISLRNSGYGYKQNGKKVWKIAQYESLDGVTPDTGKLIYCIKAGVGFGSENSQTTIKNYSQKFNLKNASSIASPYSNNVPTGENYNKLMWVIDHLYTGIGSDNSTSRENFLSSVIPDEFYELLTDDDIDVVQQLAIWYFTNPTDEYHYSDIELFINSTKNVDADYKAFEDLYGTEHQNSGVTVGTARQDAARALYSYFITNASASYVSTSHTTKPASLDTSSAVMQTIGSNYVAGPYTINELLSDVDYTLTASYKNYGTNNPITPTLAVKDTNGNIVTTNKSLKELVGTDFYLVIPTSSNIDGIDMTVSSSYVTRTATYWSVENAPSTEQPVVIVEDTTIRFSEDASLIVVEEKPFDLALRKFITGINEQVITDREPDVVTTNLANNSARTATYNHPKTSLRVTIGDIITYTIRVYNEGEADGYAAEITDYLPAGLEYIVDDPTNVSYKWQLTSDMRTVKTSYLSKANETTEGENKIAGYDGGDTLSYKEVKIRCKVTSVESMPKSLTNIAEITAATDENEVAKTDRDSETKNVTVPTGTDLENYKSQEVARGEEYIPGQEDDDDFEKVTLKEFDLSLKKFIVKAGNNVVTTTAPTYSTNSLKAGNDDATYTISKTPVAISVGDVVIYTIRIYNEGEISGYSSEITDHLPEQLEFIADNDINKKYEWTVDSTNSKIIRTAYMSRENDGQQNAYEDAARDNLIEAYDGGDTLSYKDIQVACRVISEAASIRNIAEITAEVNENGSTVTDRDSTPGNIDLPNYTGNQEDDDDYAILKLKEFDLSLKKFVTKVGNNAITTLAPTYNTNSLKAGNDDATYTISKTPVVVTVGDVVVYTIRIYNEGEISGYSSEITDHLPEQLEFIADNDINKKYEWTVDSTNSKIIRTAYMSRENDGQQNVYEDAARDNLIEAYDGGDTLSYKDIQVACKVVSEATRIRNIAEITSEVNENGSTVTDRDSTPGNVDIPNYNGNQEDDDDYADLRLKQLDLALRKFITGVNEKEITDRIPTPNTESINKLINGTTSTLEYEHTKSPLKVMAGDTVIYTIRVYNEGELDAYAAEITDYLPDQLELVADSDINKKYEWVVDSTNSKIIKTSYMSQENDGKQNEKETSPRSNLIKAFDGSKLSYKDVQVECKVVVSETGVKKVTNLAEITKSTNKNGVEIKDRDSYAGNLDIPDDEDLPNYKDDKINQDYVPGNEDDDDFEKIVIEEFDLSLKKFITAVNTTDITTRYPVFKIDENGQYIYETQTEPVLVTNGAIITYTIRVYNEGEVDGYAKIIKDNIPEGLEFVQDNEVNLEYGWILLDEDGKETTDISKATTVATDYLSKDMEKTAGSNLIKAFDPTTMKEPDYKDVKVAFKVTNTTDYDRIVENRAQIAAETNKDGEDVKDKDSTPDEWIDGEDDQDTEHIKVQYFDLSLQKWTTQTILIENGETTVTETGNTPENDPIVKVEIKDKKINSVTIKFKYKIRVTNDGQIAGYAKEVTDYIPEGLKFVAEDNPGWKQVDDNTVITEQTKDILLKPGESTDVEVILTWINGKENMGSKKNIAEISKDYNEFNTPDKDSTPGNKVEGEDDQDDARIVISVQTGEVQRYVLISGTVLIILAVGIALIKKFVI